MTRKMRMLLSAMALIVIVAGAWFFLISPLRSDIAATDAAIEQQHEKLSQAQAKLAQAQTTRAEGRKNQAKLMELAKMVPQSSQVPSLLVQIQDLADQSGIDFLSVTPGEPTEATGFQIIPLQLQFTGSYFDLSDFAYRVEQLVAAPGRLMTVKSIQLKIDGGSDSEDDETTEAQSESPLLGVTMTLYAFCMEQSTASQPTASGTTKSANASNSSAAASTTSTKN